MFALNPNLDRPIHKSLQISLLVGLAMAAISAGQISAVVAQSNTPAYVLGVSNPSDPLILDLQNLTSSLTILPAVSSLSLIAPNSILFIDGTWLQSASSLDPTVLSTIVGTVLNGLPTIVVRGNPAFLQNSISGLLHFGAPNLPLIAAGVKIVNTLPDGTRQGVTLQVIAGFDYAVNTEFSWAQQQLSQASGLTASPALTANGISSKRATSILPSDTSTGSTGPFWQFVIKATTDTGNFFAPVARVTSTFTVFQLRNTGSSTYKWFNFFANQTLQPGIAVYGSSFRNFREQDSVSVNFNTNMIVSHGPTALNTTGPTTVTYSIGVTAGTLGAVVTASQTQSYFLKNTNITDFSSDFSVGWVHSINPRTDSGRLTFQIIPGWTDRVPIDQGVDLSSSFTSTFATLSGSTITQTNSTNVQFSAQGG